MLPIVNLEEKIEEIGDKAWSPVDVLDVNNQVVRLAYARGEYHWHKHENEDEMFYVVKGTFTVKMKNYPTATLNKGDFLVVPKGEEHCTESQEGSYILMFEPKVVVSTGD